MHEASIAESILQIASFRAGKYEGSQVDIIRIELGSFRNVDPESLHFSFDSMKQDVKFCEESSLEIQIIEATAICQSQGHTYKPEAKLGFRCQECGGGIGRLLTGEELNVVGCVLSVPDESKETSKARAGSGLG